MHGDPNRHDACSFWCHIVLPTLASRRLEPGGVVLPRGIRKLKSLHTLGVVSIANGKAILEGIKRLTQLRKLAVRGINQKNSQEFCSTLTNLSRLESLSVQSIGESGLHGYLDGVSSPPNNLQSLKVNGTLVKLPEWIGGLQSLVKLALRSTALTEVDGTMRVLGELPNLATLRLRGYTFRDEDFNLTFHREAFPSMMVLELFRVSGLGSVEFKDGTTLKLELLRFDHYFSLSNQGFFSGLASLRNLKEFMLDNSRYKDEFLKDVQDQLAANPNGRPVLKRG